jgi:hypothetical protein
VATVTGDQATFERAGSGYIYKDIWGGHVIEARISRIGSAPQDGLKAQVAVYLDGQPVCRSSPTLTSVSGLDAFWRKLNRRREKADWGIDWEGWTESMAGRVLDAARGQGRPTVAVADIWDTVDDDDVWLLEPYILRDKHNVLYGDPGTAKSMMALQWAVLCDQYPSHLDTTHDVVPSQAHCLFLDWETDEKEIARRIKWLHEGMGITSTSGIIYRFCTQSLIAEVDYLQDQIAERWDGDDTPLLIIVDSQGLATGGQLVDEEMVISYFAALRELGGSSLTITHTNKDGDLFGSQYTLASARNLWEIRRSAVSKGQIDVALFHRKANTVAFGGQPRAYQLTFDPDPQTSMTSAVQIATRDPMETEVAPAGLSASELAYQIVRTEGQVSKDELPGLVAAYKETTEERVRAAVNTAISRHVKRGRLIERNGNLALPGSAPVEEGKDWTTEL